MEIYVMELLITQIGIWLDKQDPSYFNPEACWVKTTLKICSVESRTVDRAAIAKINFSPKGHSK